MAEIRMRVVCADDQETVRRLLDEITRLRDAHEVATVLLAEVDRLRALLGEPETEWGHQVHNDDGWIGDAVSQSSEGTARAAVDHINALGGTSRAKLVVHEVWHAETEWRVADDGQ